MTLRIGTAGWSIPRDVTDRFPSEGSGLERYAARFNAAEINSSFHRPHRATTWERWRDSVPDDFRFSVKLPKTITHQAKLVDCADLVEEFLDQALLLGNKFAVALVQLPPKLEFDPVPAAAVFEQLRRRSSARVACEPRNISWFTDEASAFLEQHDVARVAADPALCDAAAVPGGWTRLSYWRLHGSPVTYRSSYVDRLPGYATALSAAERSASECWCIFDNTASSAAAGDALALAELVAQLS